MFCPKCGTKNADEAKFCVECGAALPSRPQASAAAPQATTPQASPSPQPTGAPTSQPNPFATPKQQANPFGANAPAVLSSLPSDPVMLAGLVAGVVMVISFFLPLVGLSAFGHSYSMSGFGMTFGSKYLSGEFTNIVYLIPGIAALLVGLLVKKPQPRAIAQIVIGAITIIAFLAFMGYVNDNTYGVGKMSLAFYLFIICAIVLIACGIKTILDNKKATPTF